MTAAFVGGTTIGGQVPLLSNTYTSLLAAVTEAVAIVNTQVAALLAAAQTIRGVAVAPFAAQLEANLDVQAQLQIQLSDPTTYFTDLALAVNGVLAALEAIPAPDFPIDLQLQIEAAATVALILQGQIDLIDEAIALLTVISNALGNLSTFLSSYIATNLSSYLTTTGVYSFIFQGNLNTFGTEADLVTPLSGIPGVTPVRMVFFFVPANDVAAVNAMNAIFKVLP